MNRRRVAAIVAPARPAGPLAGGNEPPSRCSMAVLSAPLASRPARRSPRIPQTRARSLRTLKGNPPAASPARPPPSASGVLVFGHGGIASPGSHERRNCSQAPGFKRRAEHMTIISGLQRIYHARNIRDEDEIISFGMFDWLMFSFELGRGFAVRAIPSGHSAATVAHRLRSSHRLPGVSAHSSPARPATIQTKTPTPRRRRNQLTPPTASSHAHTPSPTVKTARPTSCAVPPATAASPHPANARSSAAGSGTARWGSDAASPPGRVAKARRS